MSDQIIIVAPNGVLIQNVTDDYLFVQDPSNMVVVNEANVEEVALYEYAIGSEFVKNEIPSGVINGSNALFQSAHLFRPESLEVFICGICLTIIDDYQIVNSNTIQLTASPLNGEQLKINYIKQ
jgi:hypothetical protein